MLRRLVRTSAWIAAAVWPLSGNTACAGLAEDFQTQVRPLLAKHCYACHDEKKQEGDLDLERFTSLDLIRKDVRPWQHVVEQVEVGEMPPKERPRPTAEEQAVILTWVRGMLDAEARARAGDPGLVPLRRLSNFEYDRTIHDLTGVDLRPTREFPVDGAGGEGFTNAGESLSDISPTLFTRYLDAAREIADHAVLLPDGFRFSPSKTRRDWTDEAVTRLRGAYAGMWPVKDGGIHPPIGGYLQRTMVAHDLCAQGMFDEAAAKPFGLNSKYLRILWGSLHDTSAASEPLDTIRSRWREAVKTGQASEMEKVAHLVTNWQGALWRRTTVGFYARSEDGAAPVNSAQVVENLSRQAPVDGSALAIVPLRLAVRPGAGQSSVTIHLGAREAGKPGTVVWHRPRLEGKNQAPLMLHDYATWGPAFEIDLSSAFAASSKYLAAVAELAGDPAASVESVATNRDLDAAFLKQWHTAMALVPAAANPPPKPVAPLVTADGVLGRWRVAAADSARRADAETLAKDAEKMLTGPQPGPKDPDRADYDRLVIAQSPLFTGVELKRIARSAGSAPAYGLPKPRFGGADGDSVVAAADKDVVVHLPATAFTGREFVVDAKLDEPAGDRLVRVRVGLDPTTDATVWTGPVLSGDGPAYRQMIAGNEAFRRLFPLDACFPGVIPNDEVVTVKMFHREDEPLSRLFAAEQQMRELDRLWAELRLISRQPVAELEYLPTFMGFTTQDTSKAFQQFFIDRTPTFRREADEFVAWEQSLIPRQLESLGPFAERAYRRPLQPAEKAELRALYDDIRRKGAEHDAAFRGVLARILASPSFLYRVEAPSKGAEAGPVSDWELATRLSYFLWSTGPDDELRRLAAAGKLREPDVLAAQTTRMLKDARTRSLAIEFGTQWIHVRGLADFREKNETLFPAFTAELRTAMEEEAILFFLDMFQGDRPVRGVLDADHTFVNEALAAHYGIPNVKGPAWRRIEGVRKYGRGGVLGLAGVQAKQSAASRTSPVLRGTWVVETLLGEKLPKPPANVPVLADQPGTDTLTTRQMVEQHVANPACAGCHSRIDPYGFAFERYDAIGRLRDKESGGQPVDARARLRDGTEFEGIDGLRDHLLTKKLEVVKRLFCQRLLGYALGRATQISDTALIDEMVAELDRHEGRVSAAVQAIVRSRQFLQVRGADVAVAN